MARGERRGGQEGQELRRGSNCLDRTTTMALERHPYCHCISSYAHLKYETKCLSGLVRTTQTSSKHEHNVGCNVWQVRREHEDVRKRRLDEFMAGFNCISLRLKEMYQMITLGGDAELELVDSLDPFSEACSLPCGVYLLCLLALDLPAFQFLPFEPSLAGNCNPPGQLMLSSRLPYVLLAFQALPFE